MKAIATGNTYGIRGNLRAAGFEWLPARKEWFAMDFKADYWKKSACNPTYNGRGNAKACEAIVITEVK
jgi:hypothetical protein